MKSKIYLGEKVDNKERKFGSALGYCPALIIDEDGTESNALFTKEQLDVAIARAERNPEDIPEKTIWQSFFGA
jgi:hypothetical protein